MRRDAENDPAINPNSVHAKLLINQVSACLLFINGVKYA
jgi:DNA-directed RNA polymerase